MVFENRNSAGDLLAERLSAYQNADFVIGLARGGVVVASRVAHRFSLPLDVLVVKKIPSPFQSELAVGAIAPDGVAVVHWSMLHRFGADEAYIKEQIGKLASVIDERIIRYRKGKKPIKVKGKTVIVVDDGMATGATFEVAVKWLRKKDAKKIIAAVPVASFEAETKIKPEVDALVVLDTPEDLGAIGQFYKAFPQVEDEKVVALLRTERRESKK